MMTPHDILGTDGSIARRLERYELRQEQLDMSNAVWEAFRKEHHLAVEAGTGVGKSFAYLIPAILQTAGEDIHCSGDDTPPRAVISTHTISLQEQLIDKDIPFLRSVLPFEFTAVLVKGRSNYLCFRRLKSAGEKMANLFEDRKKREMQRITAWSKTDSDGSKSSLNPEPDWEIWNEICCETGNCLGKKCPHNNDCFYGIARRRIANAQILVVNHAVLFSDLALKAGGGSILPLYRYLVLDEAHTVEQAAAEHLGISVTQYQAEYNLNRLYNSRTQKGLLQGTKIDSENRTAAQQAVDECFYAAETFFLSLQDYLDERPGSNGRIKETHIVANPLSGSMRKLQETLRHIIEKTEDMNERTELKSARDKIAALAAEVDVWMQQSLEAESVYYLDRQFTSRGRPRVSLNAVPIDIGPILREQLFNKIPSVILTSATLTNG
ncbi:MAG: DEAD/DEAH box helicase [Planctomycetaceae bacterium]|jgi:ATP-dependent DNA helicase DinG|nr:DEAD/DEAH box helicase [Planctomycetaceae bacterium]